MWCMIGSLKHVLTAMYLDIHMRSAGIGQGLRKKKNLKLTNKKKRKEIKRPKLKKILRKDKTRAEIGNNIEGMH